MLSIYERDQLSSKIDKKIKKLCSLEEKHVLRELLENLQELLKDKNLLDYQIEHIKDEIEKILTYNI